MVTRYVVAPMIIGQVPELEISQAEYEALGKAVGTLLNIADVEEKFVTLIDNYFELEQSLLSEALQALVFFGYERRVMQEAQTRISRRIINLLSSTRLYSDSLPRHAKKVLAASSGSLANVLNAPSKAYDTYLGYRVMEALRNYSQHEALPVHNWSVGGHKDMSVTPMTVNFSVSPALNIERLKASKFKKSVLDELMALKGKIELKPFAREYIEGIGEVHHTFRKETELLQKESVDLIANVRAAFQLKFPTTSTSGLGTVPLDERHIAVGETIYLSDNLLDYIKHLQLRTHSMINFAARRVQY
jgi:hypothetical protein